MIIRHNLPNYGFTRIDRKVFTNPNITDGATRLYGYLCGLRNGANFSDKYITKAMSISQAVLTKRKKELKDAGLILVDQVSPRVYVVYIGHSNMLAKQVRQIWLNEEDIENQ
jgi:hypothetical protein